MHRLYKVATTLKPHLTHSVRYRVSFRPSPSINRNFTQIPFTINLAQEVSIPNYQPPDSSPTAGRSSNSFYVPKPKLTLLSSPLNDGETGGNGAEDALSGSGILSRYDISLLNQPSSSYEGAIPIVDEWKLPEHDFTSFDQKYHFNFGVTAFPKIRTNPVTQPLFGELMSSGCGEDSYFTRYDSLGIADGVGGWAKVKGSSSAFYSRLLLHHACQELSKYDEILNGLQDSSHSTPFASTSFSDPIQLSSTQVRYQTMDPVQILSKSYIKTQEEAKYRSIQGSTTACIVMLRHDVLSIANLGDCGVMVFRDGKVFFRTEEQQHSFNHPYQLGTNSRDMPEDAQSLHCKVRPYDVILVASDGLFDNLFEEEILEEVNSWMPVSTLAECKSFDSDIPTTVGKFSFQSTTLPNSNTILDPQRLSMTLAQRAKKVSYNRNTSAKSPFSQKCSEMGKVHYGGKMDDITVLVAIVSPHGSAL
jgi:serine/threonine protein phosphatase PrpC